ncbi:MAG: L,D-transpeptidase family protein [Roseiarcus sp.]|jgi:murein L,D-transpeptidase YcbB/YkuD
MTRQSRSLRLAWICCVAAAGLATGIPARAHDFGAAAAAPPTKAAAPAGDVPDGPPFQPELPPDVDGLPPELAGPAADHPAASAPGAGASEATSPAEVAPALEAELETLLRADGASTAGAPRRERKARLAIGIFFFERGFAALWTAADGFTPRARAAIARLGRAAEDGLDLSGIAIPDPRGEGWSAARRARAEIALSQAIVAYAAQASGGRVEPGAISHEITARPEVADPLQALGAVAAAQDADAALEAFNPPHKGYRDLREKLARLRAEALPAAPIAAGPTPTLGAEDPQAPIMRTRFRFDAPAAGPGSGALVHDVRVAAAVGEFQRARAVEPWGRLKASTLRALSGESAGREEAAILANMEMWRWEPRDMGEERVEVNIPDFTLKLMRGEEVIHKARVIVGKPDTPTAIFSNRIKYLLVNPAWVVPKSIIAKEMLPKLALDPDYLIKAGFEVTRKGDTITVRQPPGEHNALGHLLFMFPNEHAIYLHDTPSRGLFAAQRRAFSHGCVRVDDPMRLGELAMGGAAAGWTQARLRALEGGVERTIFLPHPLAIHIEYFTAFVDQSGALQMRDDIYGHERRVETALGLDSRS